MTDRAALLRSWRGRLPVLAVVIACVAGVVAAVTGAVNPVSAVQFLLPGHWVYNSALGAVFHVDGSAGSVDASARVPGSAGDQVFQGDTSGYVVGESRITEFGKSSLSVEDSATPPSREEPVGIETAGGPYLVYRQDGKVVRLGDDQTVLNLGGPVGTPVATRDGTVWLPRTEAGLLCQLPSGARQVSCPVLLPKGHAGGLSVVSGRVVFVDTTKDTFHVVEKDGLGEPHDLGVDAGDDARLASTDAAGRLVILDGRRMHLVDAGLGTAGLDAAEPVTVDLDEGEYAGPVATGAVVAVVNLTSHKLITYDGKGKVKQTKELPADQGDPRLTLGEDDRIYVDGAEGEHVVVVDENGDLTDVPVKGGEGTAKPGKPAGDKGTPVPAAPRPPTKEPTKEPERPQSTPPKTPDPSVAPVVPPSQPGAPTVVNATAGNASATVSWGPANDNRSPITGYRITWAGGSTTVAGGARTAVIPGLANGTTYVFTVAAVNGVGAGPGASSNPVTPVAPVRPPSAPTNLVVDYDAATRTAVMSWDPPADLGGGTLAHYVISVTDRSDANVQGETATINDIAGTGTITFAVRAVTNTPSGQQVGAAATTAEDIPADGPPGTVSLSRGQATEEWCGESPDCAWMHIQLTGLQPNTRYSLMPDSSNENYSNPGGDVLTDANGNGVTEQFAYTGVGHTVWVTATSQADGTVTRSNDLVWAAG
jgi:hypothetical protein